MVAMSSPPGTGVPQAEQKRTLSGNSIWQEEQVAMIFPDTVYRVRTGYGAIPT